MTVVTRFAPSPTGFLHIGGARTALFNWLFARHTGGTFLLRIEDTDRERSSVAAIEAIIEGLSWLGLDWDQPPIYQSERAPRHRAAAAELLAKGCAYRCYASPEELAEMKESARAAGRPQRYDGRWRDRDPAEAPPGVAPVIRLRAPINGSTAIDDLVQGSLTVDNDQIDDMVLLRADGSPTYMLAVVVDDHDMGITHVIRGDDHLTNAFRQFHIYHAFGWQCPLFAHIPLIHGPDGAKLSKRHGDLGLASYRDEGFLPEAMANYLLRLGWSHGNDEIISRDDAVGWFDLDAVGRSPARFDRAKLTSLNAHYMRVADDQRLTDLVMERLSRTRSDALSPMARQRLARGMPALKERAKTIVDLSESARIYACDDVAATAGAPLSEAARSRLQPLLGILDQTPEWNAAAIEAAVRNHIVQTPGATLKDLAQPLRLALTGASVSPPIFEVMDVLGRSETIVRLKRATTATVEAQLSAL